MMRRLACLLLLCVMPVAFATPWGPSASMVSVTTNGFVVISGSASNVQVAIEALDTALTNRLTQSQISALFLVGTNITGASYTNGQWTINSQIAGLMAGTNIIGATYSSGQWTINSQTAGLLAGTNIVGGTYTNGQWIVPGGIESNDFFIARGDDAQAFVAAQDTLTTFGTEVYDYGGMFTTNTFRPRRSGVYLIQANVRMGHTSASTADRTQLKLHKNNQLYVWFDRKGDNLVSTTVLSGSLLEYATTDDVYQMWQDTDGTLTMTNAAGGRFFSAVLLYGGEL